MQLIRDIKNITAAEQHCVATIGNFDSVHLGHQEVLRKVKQEAKAMDSCSLAIIFEPQTMEYFMGSRAAARLTKLTQKLELFEQYGIDKVLCLRFNKYLAKFSAKQFIQKILLDKLKVHHLIIGDDFAFGSDRLGGLELLQQYLPVERLETLYADGTRVSSTHVRQALAVADFTLAKHLLGRAYAMSGHVAHGNRLGHMLGFPTANIYLHRKVLPFTGVYFVNVTGIDDKVRSGIANIGTRPTIGGDRNMLEVHILDFDEDIYGKKIEVEFLHKLRDEVKFDSLGLLKQQIEQDVAKAKQYDRI